MFRTALALEALNPRGSVSRGPGGPDGSISKSLHSLHGKLYYSLQSFLSSCLEQRPKDGPLSLLHFCAHRLSPLLTAPFHPAFSSCTYYFPLVTQAQLRCHPLGTSSQTMMDQVLFCTPLAPRVTRDIASLSVTAHPFTAELSQELSSNSKALTPSHTCIPLPWYEV